MSNNAWRQIINAVAEGIDEDRVTVSFRSEGDGGYTVVAAIRFNKDGTPVEDNWKTERGRNLVRAMQAYEKWV